MGVVPVMKKDGTLRLCVDYREINAISTKDRYPLPNIEEIIDNLAECSVFSSLDATAGYHQFLIDKRDRKKTAFRFDGGFYEFVRMPFGLCNAPATFQRAMDKIFTGINGVYVIPYLDDIIVFSKTHDDHNLHIREVLSRLKKNNIVLNEGKCNFSKKEIKILGRVISKGLVKADPTKVEAINGFKMPKTIKELRSFLGLLNFCREFIPGLSSKAKVLFSKLEGFPRKSNKAITLTEEEREVFYNLRQEISKETARCQPNLNGEFIVTTDPSDFAIGGILSQINPDGKEQLIHTFSKTLVAAEKNYSVTDKELLAVVKTLSHFRKYLIGKKLPLERTIEH